MNYVPWFGFGIWHIFPFVFDVLSGPPSILSVLYMCSWVGVYAKRIIVYGKLCLP
jgi:hypothetical protein